MKFLRLLVLAIACMSFTPVFAAIDHFDVELSSDTTNVGEALDLTITALDKDNNVVDDYLGTILVFSETDPKAELPNVLKESSYTFTLSDAGIVKFENAIIFNSVGKQDLNVYDLNDSTDSISGLVEVDVKEPSELPTSENITITSPENNATLTSNSLSIAGNTASNYRVMVNVDGTDYEAISNSDGVFEVTVNNLSDGDKILMASVLNADEEKIGESEKVTVKINSSAPTLLGITATPDELYPSKEISIEVISQKGLEKVEMMLNDNITTLDEVEEGKYTTKLLAPAELGEYPISVTLQNALGLKSENSNAATVKVIEEPVLNSAETVTEPVGDTITKDDLKITGLKLTKLKTKSILTWDNIEIADYYNVYIKEGEGVTLAQKVTEPRITVYITGKEIKYEDFVVRAIVEKNKAGEMLEGDLSDAVKIQTGPEKYLLLILAALIIGLLVFSPKILFKKS